jgi:DNA (cytosine-5)-methyltransferase 1
MKLVKRVLGVDLFSGCGGVSRGFINAGIDVRVGVDSEGAFKSTYELNNRGARFHHKSIREIRGCELAEMLSLGDDDCLIVASCAPCQPFSLKNGSRMKREDERADLSFETLRLIRELKAIGVGIAGLFFENVPEFSKSEVWKTINYELRDIGFNISIPDRVILNCADYGVPQFRRRFVGIGVHEDFFYGHLRFPNRTHGPGLLPYVTVSDCISDLPEIRHGESHSKISNHQARRLDDINLRRIKSVRHDGGSRADFPEELVLACHKKFQGHMDVYGRMRLSEPSPTITTRCTSITNGRYGHPTQDRGISLREAARLQSFPDDFVFYGSSLELNARMVGNAVPVRLSEVIGRHFLSLFMSCGLLSE